MSKKYTYKRKSTKLDALTLERGYGYTVNVREGRLPIHGSSLSKAEFKLSDYLEVEELTDSSNSINHQLTLKEPEQGSFFCKHFSTRLICVTGH